MADNMMGMGNAKKAAVRLFVIGGTATVAKIGSDALVERLFVQTAAEQASSPRSEDDVKMYEAYRAGVQVAGGLVLGKVLWKHQKDIAMGLALGCTVGGIDRVMTAYGWDTSVRDLFSGTSTSAAGLYGRSNVRTLNGGRQTYTGPIVRERQRVAI